MQCFYGLHERGFCNLDGRSYTVKQPSKMTTRLPFILFCHTFVKRPPDVLEIFTLSCRSAMTVSTLKPTAPFLDSLWLVCQCVVYMDRKSTTTLSRSQPDSNLVHVPSALLDCASGISSLLTSKLSQTLVFLGTNLNLFYFCQHTHSTH